jgi:hypothetical protein
MIKLSVHILCLGNISHKPKIRLIWEVENHVSVHEYKVYRQDKTDGTFDLVDTIAFTPGIKTYTAYDTDIELGFRNKTYFYKVEAILRNGNTRESSDIVSWAGSYQAYELEILRGHEIYFQRGQAGYPLYLYSRKWTSSERCPVCWDVASKRAIPPTGGCPMCYGTGVLNPLLPKELVWVSPGSEAISQAATDIGRVVPVQDSITMNGTPQVFPGDYLYDPYKHIYLGIQGVTPIGQHMRPVLQTVSVKAIEEADSLYKYLTLDSGTDLAELDHDVNANKKLRKW